MFNKFWDPVSLSTLLFLALASVLPSHAHAQATLDFESADPVLNEPQILPVPPVKVATETAEPKGLPTQAPTLLTLRVGGSPNSRILGKVDPTKYRATKRGNFWVRVQEKNGSKKGWIKKTEWDKAVTDPDLEAQFVDPSGNCPNGNCTEIRSEMQPIEVNNSNFASAFGHKRMSSSHIGNIIWAEAIESRCLAEHMGGGRINVGSKKSPKWVCKTAEGNRSKGMCARATKQALTNLGVCTSYPEGHAVDTHVNGSLARSCPGLKVDAASVKLKGIKNNARKKKAMAQAIEDAPIGSVIVYSGYAGATPHTYGHIETKMEVTNDLLQRVRRSHPHLRNVKAGDVLYCSDFCRATPTLRATNAVAAIYNVRSS